MHLCSVPIKCIWSVAANILSCMHLFVDALVHSCELVQVVQQGKGMKRSTLGSGGQRLRLHKAKDRFGGMEEASLLTPLARVAFLVENICHVSTVITSKQTEFLKLNIKYTICRLTRHNMHILQMPVCFTNWCNFTLDIVILLTQYTLYDDILDCRGTLAYYCHVVFTYEFYCLLMLLCDLYFIGECTCKLWCARIQKSDHATCVHRLADYVSSFVASWKRG